MNTTTKNIALIITIATIIIWFLSGLIIYTTFPEGKRGEIGDMFGAVNALFAGIALIGIVVAIILQQKELELQREELKSTREVFQKQKFENTFFNLLSMQHQILNGIHHEYVDNGQTLQVKGREFFNHIQEHMTNIYNLTKHITEDKIQWNYTYFTSNAKSVINEYSIEESQILELSKNEEVIKELDIVLFCDRLIFEKYQYKYAHYFRHLYRMLKLIKETEEDELRNASNDVEVTNIKKRFRGYSKFVQAQMSTSELFIMTYNSLKFGKTMDFVNKYEFLENLQKELLLDTSHEDFYNFKFKSRKKYFDKNKTKID